MKSKRTLVGMSADPKLHARIIALAKAENRSAANIVAICVKRCLPELEREAALLASLAVDRGSQAQLPPAPHVSKGKNRP